MDQVIERVRTICLAFPGASEKDSWGNPTFRTGGRIFVWAMTLEDDEGRAIRFVTLKAADGDQESLAAEGHPFFSPNSSGRKGWIGVLLDDDTDWAELRELIEDSFREIAAKRRIAELDA